MLKVDLGIKNFTKSNIYESLLKESVFFTLKYLNFKQEVEISLAFVGDRRMRDLNRRFRNIDKSTDVLSFGFSEDSDLGSDGSLNMGEIFISMPYAKKQAKKLGINIKEELVTLSAHGVIHLSGIDHERSDKEHEKTEKIQKEVLNNIF